MKSDAIDSIHYQTRINQLRREQGWDDASMVHLLMNYIEEIGMLTDLVPYLEETDELSTAHK